MDFASIPLFNLMKEKLHYLSERQGVLARNIANADTPDYHAQDVEAPDFKAMLQGSVKGMGGMTPLPMAATKAGHMAAMPIGGGLVTVDRPLTDELNPNGNNVVIEEEMSKVAANQGEYTLAMNLYSKTIGMFKTALGTQGGG